jgi:hypothetical protein
LPDRPFLPTQHRGAPDQERSTVRQLVRVVAATAALLGVLALPAPVAAETAEQCQAALHSYRAKAGLD